MSGVFTEKFTLTQYIDIGWITIPELELHVFR